MPHILLTVPWGTLLGRKLTIPLDGWIGGSVVGQRV